MFAHCLKPPDGRRPGLRSPDRLLKHGPIPLKREPRIIPYGPSDVQHEGLEVMDVVHADENRSKHLVGKKKMPQIGPALAPTVFSLPATPATGQAGAPWLDDPIILLEPGILEVDPALAGEVGRRPPVSGGQDTV